MHMSAPLPQGVAISAAVTAAFAEILSPEALGFVAKLHRKFESRRQELLAARAASRSWRRDSNLRCSFATKPSASGLRISANAGVTAAEMATPWGSGADMCIAAFYYANVALQHEMLARSE